MNVSDTELEDLRDRHYLRYDAEVLTQLVRRKLACITAAHRNAAVLGQIEALNELRERALAAA